MTRNGCLLFAVFCFLFFATMLVTGYAGMPFMISCSLGLIFAAAPILVILMLQISETERKQAKSRPVEDGESHAA